MQSQCMDMKAELRGTFTESTTSASRSGVQMQAGSASTGSAASDPTPPTTPRPQAKGVLWREAPFLTQALPARCLPRVIAAPDIPREGKRPTRSRSQKDARNKRDRARRAAQTALREAARANQEPEKRQKIEHGDMDSVEHVLSEVSCDDTAGHT